MRKILTCLLLLYSFAGSAQENNATNVEKIISEKSFVFVSTASFGDKSLKAYNPHKTYHINDTHTPAFPYYDGKISVPNQTERMILVENLPAVASKLPRNNNSETAVIYLEKESVTLNPEVIKPTWLELRNADLSDLASPVNYSNYTVKRSKKGKTKIKFDVNGDLAKKRVFLTVLPDGQSSLTIVSAADTKSFKGFIAAI